MKLENVKLSLYKYRMKSLILGIGKGDKAKKYTVENSLILGISITNLYEKYYFPYFTIEIAVPTNIGRDLINPLNQDYLTAVVDMQKGKFTDAMQYQNIERISWKTAIKETFHVIINQNEPETSEKLQKLVENSSNNYGELTVLTLLLYPKKYYDTYDIVVNDNLHNVTLVEALTYVLNKAKVKDILLSPPALYKKYKQFLIVPIRLCEQLERITNLYALHKNGTIVFFDIDRLYIIEKTSKCTAWELGENKITYISFGSEGSVVRNTGGAYVDTKKKFNLLNATNIDFSNKNGVTKKTVGDNIISISNDGKITKTNKKSSKVTNVVVETEGNSTPNAITRTIKESKKIMTCKFLDCDINMFTPNKEFVVSIEGSYYKKYNGKYRLTSVAFTFEKEGDYFSVNASASLKG